MGNQIVIPSYGDWYVEPLRRRGINVRNPIESGTFFIALKCTDLKGRNLFVKCYQYTRPLKELEETAVSEKYFKEIEALSDEVRGITPYVSYFIEGNNVFLIREDVQYTLTGRLCEYPPLYEAEKLWIAFQIFNSVGSLHEANLIHGSLNPDNILLTENLKTTICDMAPFKPSQVREDKPNLFYHYFTTATRSACYLAPEQVLPRGTDIEQLQKDNRSYASDIFSVASIIYFLYSGEHLFTFSQIIQYAKNEFTPNIDCIPDKIRDTIKGMLSLDKEKRISTFEKAKTVFPGCFQQLFEQVCTFNRGGTTLLHVIALIPVFESITEKSYEARIIFSRVFSPMLQRSCDANSLVKFLPFFAQFATKIDDEYVLTNILPYFVELLDSSSSAVVCASLRAIFLIISDFQKVLDGFFNSYLLPKLSELYSSPVVAIRATLAYNLPQMILKAYEICENERINVDNTLHFILSEGSEVVLMQFADSMIKIAGCPFAVFNSFFAVLMSGFNSKIARFRAKVLEIFMVCYDKCPESEKKEYFSLYTMLCPAVCGFLDEVKASEGRAKFLQMILWFEERNMIDKSRYPEIFKMITKKNIQGNEQCAYFTKKIIATMPKEFEAHIIPEFLWGLMSYGDKQLSSPCKERTKEIRNRGKRGRESIIKADVQLRPAFLFSERSSNVGFKCCAQNYSSEIIAVSADVKGTIYITTDNMKTNVYLENPSPVNCIAPLRERQSSIIGDDDGVLKIINWEKGAINQIKTIQGNSIASIVQVSTDVLIATTKNGAVHCIDLRIKDKANTMKFDDLTCACSCKWPLAPYVGIGFNEGIVDVIDPRMFLPVSSVITESPTQIIPIVGDELSFAISSKGLDCYSCTNGRTMSFNKGEDTLICEYDGGVVCIDESDVYYINPRSPKDSSMLFDLGRQLMLDYNDNEFKKPTRQFNTYSLHKHTQIPSCACRPKDLFVSFDSLGFTNFWTLSKI